MLIRPTRVLLVFERILPWIVLILLGVYSYANFVISPSPGFEMSNGVVSEIHTNAKNSQLKIGDRVVSIGDINIDEYLTNIRVPLFTGAEPGETIPIEIKRDEQKFSINWVYAGRTHEEIIQNLNSGWWLPYILWMAGTATMLFIRPKDLRWRLLVAFNYLTALWLVTGSGPAKWHLWGSALFMRMAIWMTIPVYLHLHWVFPRTLKKLPRIVWGGVYAIGVSLAIMQFFELLSSDSYYTGFLIAVLGSVVLILAHAIFQKDARKEIGWLVLVVLLVLIPIAGSVLAEALNILNSAYLQGGSLLALPALPGAYFFVAYRRQLPSNYKSGRLFLIYLAVILLSTILIVVISVLSIERQFFETKTTIGVGIAMLFMGITISIVSFTPFIVLPALAQTENIPPTGTIQIRANRMLTLLIALIGIALLFGLLTLALSPWLEFNGAPMIVGTIAAIASGLLSIIAYPSLQKFVDQKIIRMSISPAQLERAYAEHITTSLDRDSLTSLINDEILPSLLIRQSALLNVENLSFDPICLFGIDETKLPSYGSLAELLNEANQYRPVNDAKFFPWIRLILPLIVEGKIRGLWLLGRRDPDDYYSAGEVDLLKTIANQTAIALANIFFREHILTLYQDNILRHEDERKKLAHDLHDDILNGLAVLGMFVDDESISPKFQKEYDNLTSRIRQMISGLRPAMLDYGLYQAIKELIQELEARPPADLTIHNLLESSPLRYESSLEGHIYRIVQQALENAVQHAQASTISISGELSENHIYLIIVDDGIGFDFPIPADISTQNGEKHYGLIMMQERAEIIGTVLKLDSSPGNGTKITLEINNVLQKQSEYLARIKAEEALFDSEAKAQTLMNVSTDVILLLDMDDVIIDANEAMAQRVNKNLNELIGKIVWDFIPLQVAKLRKSYQDQVLATGKYVRFEDERAGRWNENFIYPITDTNGTINRLAIFSRDITDRKNAEADLIESESITREIMNGTPDLILLIDIEGFIIKANNSLASQFDKKPNELIGVCLWDLLPHEMITQRKPFFEEELRTVKQIRFEDNRNGNWYDILVNPIRNYDGKIIRFAVYAREISDKKLLEQNLQENIEKSKTLLNASPSLIALHKIDGTILEANQSMAQRLDSSVDELIGQCIWDYFPPEVTKSRQEYAQQVLESRQPVQFQDQNQGAYFDTTLYPLFDADGNVNKFAVFVREIDRKGKKDSDGV